jgi:hypothetical protein
VRLCTRRPAKVCDPHICGDSIRSAANTAATPQLSKNTCVSNTYVLDDEEGDFMGPRERLPAGTLSPAHRQRRPELLLVYHPHFSTLLRCSGCL